MSPTVSSPTRLPQPIILIRGFGGLGVDDEKSVAYQGFNDGTVYPHKRGENYIYEGLILRFMKSRWQYRDATNIVGYYPTPVREEQPLPKELQDLDVKFFTGDKVVIDPGMALALRKSEADPRMMLWVFRYYDLDDRKFAMYGKALLRLIDFIRALSRQKDGSTPKVNIIAHSMGGLIVREALQRAYPKAGLDATQYINKIVTLGTPHRGITFQVVKDWIRIDAEKEIEHFNPKFQANPRKDEAYVNFGKYFPPERLLCVVGTNYRTYGAFVATKLNRLFAASGEFGLNYNRSDGLVKQISAQIPGAPRTFVHKCHGGPDSLVTSREAFEVATRFFFGNIHARLYLVDAAITRGLDRIGKSEIFFGVSIKPRGVDFELFHQSAEAENCYGPFRKSDLSDDDVAFDWAGSGRLIWEGRLDTTARTLGTDFAAGRSDIVMRLDVYIGERDLFGVGFSDNIVFRKQYYVRAVFSTEPEVVFKSFELYTGEEFADRKRGNAMQAVDGGWEFSVKGTGFEATMRISLDPVPDVGP